MSPKRNITRQSHSRLLKCSKCGDFKPDADFNQCLAATARRQRAYWCRDCYSAYNSLKHPIQETAHAPIVRPEPQKTKKSIRKLVCTKCTIAQPITNFSKSKKATTRQGHAYWCKSCHQKYKKQYEKQNQTTQPLILPSKTVSKENSDKTFVVSKRGKPVTQSTKTKKIKKLFCTKCKQRKPDKAFHVSNSAKLRRKRTYWCKDCSANYRATKVSATTTPAKQQTQKPMEPMHYVSAIRQPYCPDHLL